MKATLTFDAEQWDGSDDEANRLGLVFLRVVHAPAMSAWHLPTIDGPVLMAPGDWIVARAKNRQAVRQADFVRNYTLS